MELAALMSSTDKQLQQVEPVRLQLGLDPYLADLDISEALDGFSKFADMIQLRSSLEDQQQHQHQHPQPCWSPSPSSCRTSSWNPSSSSSSFSPSSSSASCSGASSPAPSDRTTYSSSGSSSFSSSGRSSTRSKRRTKNASAAERYRKRLKGRECGLAQQMERELERNARLRRDLESKLALYREFIQLLAFNTSKSDAYLAQLGSKSLTNILQCLGNFSGDASIETETRFELEAQQAKFQRIIRENSAQPAHNTGH